MKPLNYEDYYYSLNIANYETWSDEKLLRYIENAKQAMERIEKDVYDKERIKKYLPPTYVVDGYRWAKSNISSFEQELKKRGVMEKDEIDLMMESFWDDI